MILKKWYSMTCIPNCSVIFQQLSDQIHFLFVAILLFTLLAYVLMQDSKRIGPHLCGDRANGGR